MGQRTEHNYVIHRRWQCQGRQVYTQLRATTSKATATVPGAAPLSQIWPNHLSQLVHTAVEPGFFLFCSFRFAPVLEHHFFNDFPRGIFNSFEENLMTRRRIWCAVLLRCSHMSKMRSGSAIARLSGPSSCERGLS